MRIVSGQGNKVFQYFSSIGARLCAVDALRMPLYAQHRQCLVDDSLNAAVQGTGLYGFQPLPQTAKRLVMGAVDAGFLSVEPAEPGTADDYGCVIFVSVFVSVAPGCERGQVLNDLSAQSHIDDLHPLADAQYRLSAFQRQVEGQRSEERRVGKECRL